MRLIAAPILVIAGCSLGENWDAYRGSTLDAGASLPATDAGTDVASSTEGGSTTPDSNAYVAAVTADGPLLHLRFEDNLTSAGSLEVPVNVTGGTITFVRGAVGKGAKLADTAINTGTTFDFRDQAPFTLEAWANIELSDSEFRHLFNKDTPAEQTTKREAFGMFVQAERVGFERIVTGNNTLLEAPFLSLNKWTHLVGVFTGQEDVFYVDGVEKQRKPDTRVQGVKPGTFFIGARGVDHGFVHGTIDEIAVYDRALTADRVKAHFEAAPK